MVSFFVVESIHLYLNYRFNICIIYLQLIILSVIYDVSIDSDAFLMTDFMNLKIKPTQSFKDTHRGKVYVHIFIERLLIYISVSIYVLCF
jgi:hypothetical protein